MTQVTPQQFDGMTIEERDRYLERRDQAERERITRPAPPSADQIFTSYAIAILRKQPSLIFDLRALAELVAAEATNDGVTKPSGEPYKAKTIYNHVNPKRMELLSAICGNGSR